MTGIKDLVLIHFEDQPLLFARIETIEPDVKKDWYQVTLLFLRQPLQTATWILRAAYIDGAEFTMDGKRVRLEPVVSPVSASPPDIAHDETAVRSGNVISLADLKKEK